MLEASDWYPRSVLESLPNRHHDVIVSVGADSRSFGESTAAGRPTTKGLVDLQRVGGKASGPDAEDRRALRALAR